MRELVINVENESYKIYIEHNLINNVNDYILEVYQNKKVYILTDDIVEKLYLDQYVKELRKVFEVDVVVIKNGEENKNITTYMEICTKLLEKNIRRNELLIALGGGVVGDMSGFIAATLFRGINFINIPTTLLSQLDSSIGGKTGIDFFNRKNIIGAFKQPLLVLIDPSFITTLSNEQYLSGLAELIKHAFLGSPFLLESLKSDEFKVTEAIILESLKVKKKFVENDVYDTKERMFLNFGHTFGHIIELKNKLTHGQAVMNGMLLEIKFGIDLKVTDTSLLNEIEFLLKKFNYHISYYNYDTLLKESVNDKKNIAGIINFSLLKKLYEPTLYKIKESDLK